jgi:hypothetical protein
MRALRRLSVAALLLFASAESARASAIVKRERVPSGVLEQSWTPGFGLPNTLNAAILDAANAAFANPSGDHTVGVLANAAPDSGGLALACTDVNGLNDYQWEGWFFTGAGDTRRGIILRANPANGFQDGYQLVINAGLFTVAFRKLVLGAPTTLGSWTANTFPGGIPQVNTWHHMKVSAIGNAFHCWFDDYELTGGTAIVDATDPILSGWVGVYNFRFDLGGVPVYYDDLTLSEFDPTPTHAASWGEIKSRYRSGR